MTIAVILLYTSADNTNWLKLKPLTTTTDEKNYGWQNTSTAIHSCSETLMLLLTCWQTRRLLQNVHACNVWCFYLHWWLRALTQRSTSSKRRLWTPKARNDERTRSTNRIWTSPNHAKNKNSKLAQHGFRWLSAPQLEQRPQQRTGKTCRSRHDLGINQI